MIRCRCRLPEETYFNHRKCARPSQNRINVGTTQPARIMGNIKGILCSILKKKNARARSIFHSDFDSATRNTLRFAELNEIKKNSQQGESILLAAREQVEKFVAIFEVFFCCCHVMVRFRCKRVQNIRSQTPNAVLMHICISVTGSKSCACENGAHPMKFAQTRGPGPAGDNEKLCKRAECESVTRYQTRPQTTKFAGGARAHAKK